MKNYELMYLLNIKAVAADEAVKIAKLVESVGGKIIQQDFIGKKKLAYAIKGQLEGVYAVVTFTMDEKKALEFRKNLSQNEAIIRSLITVNQSSEPRKPAVKKGKTKANVIASGKK